MYKLGCWGRLGWLEGIRKVGARGEMGEASEGQDLLIKVWVGNDFQKKRKESTKIKREVEKWKRRMWRRRAELAQTTS